MTERYTNNKRMKLLYKSTFSQKIYKNIIIYFYKSRLSHNNKYRIDNSKNYCFSKYIKMT